jgi:hypothetical protein
MRGAWDRLRSKAREQPMATIVIAAAVVVSAIAMIALGWMLYEANAQRYTLVAVFPRKTIEISRWPSAAACDAAQRAEVAAFRARGFAVDLKCQRSRSW